MTAFYLVPDEFDGSVLNPSKIHAVQDCILTGLTGLTGFLKTIRTHAHVQKRTPNKSSNPSTRQRKTKNDHPHGEQSADGLPKYAKQPVKLVKHSKKGVLNHGDHP